MKRKNLFLVVFFFLIIALQMNSCNKSNTFVGTYDGVTTTGGNVKIQIAGYIDTDEEIPTEYETVRFVVSKGSDKNKIVLKQVNGDVDQQFEAIGIVSEQTITFLPFKLPIKYGTIKVDADVLDMTAHLNKNTLTYSYTYGYSQILPGAYINIFMQANGSAVKQK